jgi:hypothetical protein
MENAVHQTTVLVKLDGKGQTATFVFLYQVVIMAPVTMLLNATAKLVGRELSVTSPAVTTAQTDSASHPMNVYAQTVGLVQTVMHAQLELDANMELVKITPTLVSVNMVGKDFSVINLHAVWIATMEFATHLAMLTQPVSACASLDGKEQAVTFADLTGDVPIRMLVHVTIPMNVSASMERLMLWDFATIQY